MTFGIRAAFMPDLDRDAAARGELDGIADQIDQDLPKPPGVAAQPLRQSGIDEGGEVQPPGDRLGPEESHYVLDDLAQAEVALLYVQRPGLDPGELEDAVEQL